MTGGHQGEQLALSGSLRLMLAVIALDPALPGLGWRTAPMSWTGLSSKQITGQRRLGASAEKTDHVLHSDDMFGIDGM
jgi:hypothetical protein